MNGVSTSIILDNRRALKNGTYPVKLRVTCQRKRKYFPTSYSLSEADFEKMFSKRPGRELKDYLLDLQGQEKRANDIIKKLTSFSFPELEKRLLQKSIKDEVFSAYDATIEKLSKEGRAATADNYKSARASIWAFSHGKTLAPRKGMTLEAVARLMDEMKQYTPLPFSAINKQFLEDYENWMLGGGRSITSVGIYLRTLRALFNEVIATGDLNPELYPFEKRKYQIPTGKNIKKALTLAEVKKVFKYNPTTESEARSRDMWIFSYLCNGINIKDIARLRHKQLDKDSIRFVRAKTQRSTRSQQKLVLAVVTPEIKDIIDKWGIPPESPDSYVFPILSPRLTPEQELAKVRQATKTINSYMRRIAEAVGIEKDITTYTARHSYSTVLKRAGVSTAFIAESLGHTSEKTTQSYLDSFEDDTKRKVVASLTDFKE